MTALEIGAPVPGSLLAHLSFGAATATSNRHAARVARAVIAAPPGRTVEQRPPFCSLITCYSFSIGVQFASSADKHGIPREDSLHATCSGTCFTKGI